MSTGNPNTRTVSTAPLAMMIGPHNTATTTPPVWGPVVLATVPGCGDGGWWCHGSCRRHGRCMYVRRVRVGAS